MNTSAMDNGLTGWTGTWNNCNWKIGDKKMEERSMHIFLSEKALSMKYLSPMWMLSNGWTKQRKLLIIRWIGWPVLWVSFSLLSQSFLPLPNGPINERDMAIRERCCTWAQQHGLWLTKLLWLQLVLSVQSANSRNQHKLSIWRLYQGDHPGSLGAS